MHSICPTSNPIGYIRPLYTARLFSLNSALTSTTPLQDWPPLHLCCCSWKSHAQLTAAVPVPTCSCPPRGPQLFLGKVKTTAQERAHKHTVSTVATFLVAVIYIATISVANVIYLATFLLHKSLAADFVPLGTGSPLWHISFRGAVLSLV